MKIEFKTIDVVRLFVTLLIFITFCQMNGVAARESQQVFFTCGIMVAMSLFLRNIWITSFIIWTIFLYILGRFQYGTIYVSNIFFGSILYLVTKSAFKKEHIDVYLRVFMYFFAFNLLYGVLQYVGYDWIYWQANYTKNGFEGLMDSNDYCGFMLFRSALGMLVAIGIPVLITRPYKLALPLSVLMFIPLYFTSSSIALLAGGIGFIVSLYYSRRYWWKYPRLKKPITVALCLAMLLGAGLYVAKKDDWSSVRSRFGLWKLVLRDTVAHPVVGWGLDTFRITTKEKEHVYAMNPSKDNNGNIHYDFWDNAHNFYVQAPFEWGYPIFIIIFGYFSFIVRKFRNAEKMPNTIALFGVCLVTAILSLSHFPLFLSRFMCFLIPMFALYDIETE